MSFKPSLSDWVFAAAVLAVLIAVANWDPFGSKRRLKAEAQTATQQSKVDGVTVKAVDHYTHETLIVREKADHAVQQVTEAPGADAPVPDNVLDAWRNGLSELRQRPDKPSDPPSR